MRKFEDGDDKREPEWPPHPSRLFSALAAAWGDSGAEESLVPALSWLEGQNPPKIYAGTCSPRKLVQAFVPVNDHRSLPEERSRKSRTFPSATLSDPDVYFVWDASPPPEVMPALEEILKRTSAVGHSSSLVAVEVADTIPQNGRIVWAPNASAGVRMRVAHEGRLKDLIERYKRFKTDPNKIHRPPAGKSALYAEPPEAQAGAPQGAFDRMIVLRREDGPRTSLRSTLSITGALRKSMLERGPQPPPEYLSGHAPESTPENPLRSERSHVAFVPLAFIDAAHATGEILGAALLLPNTLALQEAAVCWSVAEGIKELGMPWGAWRVSLTDAEERRRTLLPEMWTRRWDLWSTVTPFVFDRYPKDPYGEEPEQVVREAFVRTGLPTPANVALHYNPWHIGVPKAPLFPAAPPRPGKPRRYHCHVLARFEQPIRGPVVAGAGRYYGYGLFAPLFRRGGD